ncbi:Homeodomain-interacting protein kinase [Entamoeba marina]
MRRQRGICGKHYELRASNDSQLIQATNQSHIIGKPQSITNDATVNYLRALTKIDSTLDVTALTKLRALTQPATPRHNDGLDNINYDLILSYDEVLTGDAVYGKSGKYRVVSLLGQGSFGQVFKCREEETGELVAVKILRNRSPYFRQGMLEIAVLTLLKEKFDVDGTGANNKTVYELKKKSVFERENDLVLEANREYFDYQSLTDFVSRVPLRVNSREEHRTTEYRRAFSDFLRKILVWNPSQRLTPSQAICHPFITKTTFTPPVNLPDAIPPPLVHPPGSLTTPDEVLRYLFPTAHSDQLRVAPLHNNIILSILHQNPFAIPPITPASLEIWADKHSLKVNKSAPRTASTTNVPDGKGQEKEKNTKNTYSTR